MKKTIVLLLVLVLFACSFSAEETALPEAEAAVEVVQEPIVQPQEDAAPPTVAQPQAGGYGPQGIGGNTLEVVYPPGIEHYFTGGSITNIFPELPRSSRFTVRFRIANDMEGVDDTFIKTNIMSCIDVIDTEALAYVEDVVEYKGYDAEANIIEMDLKTDRFTPGGEYMLRFSSILCGKNPNNTTGIGINFEFTVSDEGSIPLIEGLAADPREDGILLSWSTNKDVDGYIIYTDGEEWGQVKALDDDPETLEILMKDAEYGRKYEVSIAGYTDDGAFEAGPVSQPVYSAVMPKGVGALSATGVNTDRIILNWNESPDADGYTIFWGMPGSDIAELDVANINGRAQSKMFDKLGAGTEYLFKVTPYIELQDGGKVYGNNTGFTAFDTVMSPVTGLKYTSKTRSSLTVKWDSASFATHYRIYVNNKRVATTKVTEANLGNSYVIKGLQPSTKYSVKVCAVNRSSGRSIRGASDAIKATTGK